MQFTCLQENLAKSLSTVYRAIPTKNDLPILSNVLITAKDNILIISATNLSTTIVTQLGASIEKEGSITVPAKIIRDFVSTLTPSTIELDLQEDILHLKSETTKSKFHGVSAEDYPDLPTTPKKKKVIGLDPREFADAINLVSYAAAMDETRPIFTGIYLDFDSTTLTIAASDGFRLSETKLKIPEQKDKFTVIIPSKTLSDITRVFNMEETVKFTLDSNNNLTIFEQEDVFVATRIIDGAYPDYGTIVPKKGDYKATFSTAEFLDAVKLTNIFAKEVDSGAASIIVALDPKKKSIQTKAIVQEKGAHESKFSAEVEAPEKIEIGFNSRYLLDFLNNIRAEEISILTAGKTTPCLFTTKEIPHFYHIIMPIQINGV
ncbi:DNA polymerase III subunit beta [Patescibacteria group bacterium]